jgi:hypothetical protein
LTLNEAVRQVGDLALSGDAKQGTVDDSVLDFRQTRTTWDARSGICVSLRPQGTTPPGKATPR